MVPRAFKVNEVHSDWVPSPLFDYSRRGTKPIIGQRCNLIEPVFPNLPVFNNGKRSGTTSNPDQKKKYGQTPFNHFLPPLFHTGQMSPTLFSTCARRSCTTVRR